MSDSELSNSDSSNDANSTVDEHQEDGSAASTGHDDKKEAFKDKLGVDTLTKGSQGYISFRSNNSFAPNATVAEDYFQGYDSVAFAYDEEEDDLWLIPLKSYDEHAEDEYKLPDEIDGSFVISSTPIFKKVGLDFDNTHRYTPEWRDEMGALCVDLDQDADVYTTSSEDDDS